MKKVKWITLVILAIVLGTMVIPGAVYAVPDKEPIDKIVFVHYPKHATGKPAKTPGKGSDGVLSSSYKYSGIHWANPDSIPYYVNPSGSGVDSGATVTAINASLAAWDNADGPLGFVYQGTTTLSGGAAEGANIISWADISSQYSNAIAVTSVWYYRYSKTIAEVDTLMNTGGMAWSYTAPNITPADLSGNAVSDASRYEDPTNVGIAGTYDIRNIMTHEAGHWIMLGDLYNSRDSKLTMYGYGSLGELQKDTLAYGDELGVEKVYPY